MVADLYLFELVHLVSWSLVAFVFHLNFLCLDIFLDHVIVAGHNRSLDEACRDPVEINVLRGLGHQLKHVEELLMLSYNQLS